MFLDFGMYINNIFEIGSKSKHEIYLFHICLICIVDDSSMQHFNAPVF